MLESKPSLSQIFHTPEVGLSLPSSVSGQASVLFKLARKTDDRTSE